METVRIADTDEGWVGGAGKINVQRIAGRGGGSRIAAIDIKRRGRAWGYVKSIAAVVALDTNVRGRQAGGARRDDISVSTSLNEKRDYARRMVIDRCCSQAR